VDIVFINKLKVEAIIGIFDVEREARQTVEIDVEMGVDIAPAAASESIDDALDYSAVVSRIRELVIAGRFQLLETMAERIAQMVMAEFNVPWLRVSCAKPQALQATDSVGVRIERGRRPDA